MLPFIMNRRKRRREDELEAAKRAEETRATLDTLHKYQEVLDRGTDRLNKTRVKLEGALE